MALLQLRHHVDVRYLWLLEVTHVHLLRQLLGRSQVSVAVYDFISIVNSGCPLTLDLPSRRHLQTILLELLRRQLITSQCHVSGTLCVFVGVE